MKSQSIRKNRQKSPNQLGRIFASAHGLPLGDLPECFQVDPEHRIVVRDERLYPEQLGRDAMDREKWDPAASFRSDGTITLPYVFFTALVRALSAGQR